MTNPLDQIRFALDALRDATDVLEAALAAETPGKPPRVDLIELTLQGQPAYVAVRQPGMKFWADWAQPVEVTGFSIAPSEGR